MVDVTDSKSVGGNTVWVRVPPPAPRRSKLCIACSDFFQKSERAHAAAPPLQPRPAALGSWLGPPFGRFVFFGDPVRGCRFSLSIYGSPLRDRGTVSVKTVGTHSVRPQASSVPLTWQGAATRRAAVQGPFSPGRSGSPAAKPVRWLILSPAAARVRRGGSGQPEIEQMFYPVAI